MYYIYYIYYICVAIVAIVAIVPNVTRSLDQGPGSSGGPQAQLLDDWMAGLAGGGGISIIPDVPYMNHT